MNEESKCLNQESSIHAEVIKFINLVKGHKNPCGNDAHQIIEEIYQNGNCYKFAQMLQFVFPDVELYGVTITNQNHISHVIAKINDKYYDISGEWRKGEYPYYNIRLLTANDHEICDTYVYSFLRRHAFGLRDENGNIMKRDLKEKLAL